MRKTAALDMGVLESARCGGDLMRVDLLAIAAHPDDVELTCGGDADQNGSARVQNWHS